MKKLRYCVSTGGKWIATNNTGIQNFKVFDNPRAALRYLKGNPKRQQIDIRGINKRGKPVRFCWKYWKNNKIITQDE